MKVDLPSRGALAAIALLLGATPARGLADAAADDAPNPPAVATPGSPATLRPRDPDFTLQVGGDIQADSRAFFAEEGQGLPDQFLLRRARARLRGAFQRNVAFVLTVNLAGGRAVLNNTFLELRFTRWARLRVGKLVVPVGLELAQSADDTAFTERALPSNLAPYFSAGVALLGEVATALDYQVAVTDVTPDGTLVESDVSDTKEVTGRLFVHPLRAAGVPALAGVAFGASASYGVVRGRPTATQLPLSYKTDAQNDFFAYVVTTNAATGKVDAANTVYAEGGHLRWSAQGSYALRILGLQAEYVRSTQRVRKGAFVEKPQNWGWQATARVVLTGEDASLEGGVVPRRAFDPATAGWGAVEVVARYALLKVDARLFAAGFADPTVSAREARAWGTGANWYLTRNVRVSADFTRTTFRDGATTASGDVADRKPESAVLTRVQTVF